MGQDISGFAGLEPEHIITNDGMVDEDTFEVEIRPYVREYFDAFYIDGDDLSDDDLSSLTLQEFQALLADPERYQADPGFAGTTLASYQRAEDFIHASRTSNQTKAEIPPPAYTLAWPPVSDESEQVTKLQEMVLPVLDSARESLHNLTTVNSFRFPADAENVTHLRPMTFNLFVLSLARFFSSGNSESFGEFKDSGDYFTGALDALMPDWADFLGPKLGTLFGHLNVKNAETSSMQPLNGLDVMSRLSMGDLTQSGLSPEDANLFVGPDFLVNLAKQLIADHPEILLQLENFEQTEVYQEVLKQTAAMEQKIIDYRTAVAEIDSGDFLATQRLMSLIPNADAQMSLLANLGIDPRIDPNGEKPSWMGEDCWQASCQYVLGMGDLANQQLVESFLPIVVMTCLGALAASNPFTALGLAALSAPGFSWFDIHTEQTARAHAEAGRVASQALSATATVINTPHLATDANVDDADERVESAIDRAPYDLALNALGLGAGAGIKLVYRGAVTAIALDMGAQSLVGTSSAVFDQRNWSRDEDGNWELSDAAVGTAFLFSLVGGTMGHTVGTLHTSPAQLKRSGIPTDTIVIVREVDGQQVALSIDPKQVTWNDRLQGGQLRGTFALDANGTLCEITIDYNTNRVEFVMPQAATDAPTNSPRFSTLAEAQAWARQNTKEFGCEYSYMQDKDGYHAVRLTGKDADAAQAPTDVFGGRDGPEVNAWFGARLVGHTHDGLPIASFADIDNVAAQTALSGFETTLLTDGVMPNGDDVTLTIKVKRTNDQVTIEVEGDAPLRALAETDADVAAQMAALDADVSSIQGEINGLLRSGDTPALRERASQPLQTRDEPPQGPRAFPVRRGQNSVSEREIPKESLKSLKLGTSPIHSLARASDGTPVNIRYDATRGRDGFVVSGSCVVERGGGIRNVTDGNPQYLADGDVVVIETLSGKVRYRFSDPSKVVVQPRLGSEGGNAGPAYVVPPAVPQGSQAAPTQYISLKPKTEQPAAPLPPQPLASPESLAPAAPPPPPLGVRRRPPATPRPPVVDSKANDLPPGVVYTPYDPDHPEFGGMFRIPTRKPNDDAAPPASAQPRAPQPPASRPAPKSPRVLADADTTIPRNIATVVLRGTEANITPTQLADLKSGRIGAICLGSSESVVRIKITYDTTSGKFVLHNFGETPVKGFGTTAQSSHQRGLLRAIDIPPGKSDTLEIITGFDIVVEVGIWPLKSKRTVHVEFPQNSLELAPDIRMRADPRPNNFRTSPLTQAEIGLIFRSNNDARGPETRLVQIMGTATLAQEIVLNPSDIQNINNIKNWCEQACRDNGYTGYELKDASDAVLYRTRVF